jgi:predicted amidohydrolase
MPARHEICTCDQWYAFLTGCHGKLCRYTEGAAVQLIQTLAKKWRMNIVLPLHEQRGEKFFNTGVVVDRDGKVVGTYSKVFPVFGNTNQTVPPTAAGGGEVTPPDSVSPSLAGVKVFDLDFGRIAVVICYDINFAELWMQAEALGADMVVWPSAMHGARFETNNLTG